MTPARTTAKRFGWALAISLLVHLALGFGYLVRLPRESPPAVIEATLRELPPPPPARKIATSRPHRAARRHPRQPAPPHVSAPAALPTSPSPPAEAAAAEPPPTPEPPPAPPEPEATEEAPIPLPEQAHIKYILYKGRDGFVVGKADHTWKRDGTHYAITQVAEATGIVSLFYGGRHVQIGQGEITSAGLRPDSYWVQRGQAPDKTDTAQFDWESNKLTLGTGGNTRRIDLPPGTQDLLSFPYQLAFSPPLTGSAFLYLTTGRNLEKYGYQSLGEDVLDTPMGRVKALHVGKLHREGEENTEIWLAPEYHYLPVKIRHTDRDGGVIEQTAASIEEK